MTIRLVQSLGALLSLIWMQSAHCGEDLNVRLREASEEAMRAVEDATGVKLRERVSLQIVDRRAHKRTVDLLRQQWMDAAGSSKERPLHLGFDMVLARFDPESDAVMVCPETVRRTATDLNVKDLLSSKGLRAMFVHEYLHAVDNLRYRCFERLAKIKSRDENFVYNAIIEGNAQYLARLICAEEGWDSGFAVVTQIMTGQLPESRNLSKVLSLTFGGLYLDGEAFMAEMHKAGNDVVQSAFESPPADYAILLHPSWFLGLERRPPKLYDLSKGLEDFQERCLTASAKRISTPSHGSFRALLSPLGEDKVSLLVRSIQHMKLLRLPALGKKRYKGTEIIAIECLSGSKAEELSAGLEQTFGRSEGPTNGAFRVRRRSNSVQGTEWEGVCFSVETVLGVEGDVVLGRIFVLVGTYANVVVLIRDFEGKSDEERLQDLCDCLVQYVKRTERKARGRD